MDAVTSRAVAPLDRLVKWSAPLIRTDGRLVAMKGSSAQEEIAEHGAACAAAGVVDLIVESVGGELLADPTTVIVGRRTAGRSGRVAKAKPGRRDRRAR